MSILCFSLKFYQNIVAWMQIIKSSESYMQMTYSSEHFKQKQFEWFSCKWEMVVAVFKKIRNSLNSFHANAKELGEFSCRLEHF